MDTKFKAGDKVCIIINGISGRRVESHSSIKRIMKRFIELDNGDKFALDGRLLKSRGYSKWLELETPELLLEEEQSKKRSEARILINKISEDRNYLKDGLLIEIGEKLKETQWFKEQHSDKNN